MIEKDQDWDCTGKVKQRNEFCRRSGLLPWAGTQLQTPARKDLCARFEMETSVSSMSVPITIIRI